jgi:hypothetical protein
MVDVAFAERIAKEAGEPDGEVTLTKFTPTSGQGFQEKQGRISIVGLIS